MKKLIIIILIVGVATIGFIYLNKQKEAVVPVVQEQTKPIELCFYNEKKASSGFYDAMLLKMKLFGGNVTGEFRNLPAEKDKKIGTFTGLVGPVNKIMMARTADVWWNSEAEGMQVKEQLKIIFGEGTAQIGFGEMIDRGDGAYIYKDESAINYDNYMTDVACGDIDDRLIVGQYVRDNIKTLVPAKAVLGGTWYLVSVHIDPSTKTGDMIYEDGHIQGEATFSYERTDNVVTISNIIKKK